MQVTTMPKVSFFPAFSRPIFAPASTRSATLVRPLFNSLSMPHVPIAFSALLLSLALTGTAQAQPAAPVPADTARTYKHHLGLTASPVLNQFFTANRSLPVGLLYKRQTAPNKLWRFGLVVNQDYSRRDEVIRIPLPNVKSNEEYILNHWGVSASVGQEFIRRFSRRWTGVAGADASVGYSRFTRNSKRQIMGNTNIGMPLTEPIENEQTNYYSYYRASVAPFCGVRFAIRPYLYASAESSINLAYSRVVSKGTGSVKYLLTGNVIGDNNPNLQVITDQAVNLRFRLINQLTLHYQFGR